MTSPNSSTQVIFTKLIITGGTEILVQNAGQDATTQFEDINHSAKAQIAMRDLYIGEFFNPEEAKESWEDYVKRKKREDEGKLKLWQQAILLLVYAAVFFGLYTYLKSGPTKEQLTATL